MGPEDADALKSVKNKNGSTKGNVAAKEQSVSPIQSENVPGSVA